MSTLDQLFILPRLTENLVGLNYNQRLAIYSEGCALINDVEPSTQSESITLRRIAAAFARPFLQANVLDPALLH